MLEAAHPSAYQNRDDRCAVHHQHNFVKEHVLLVDAGADMGSAVAAHCVAGFPLKEE
jgi:hypothetical protein